MISEDYEDVCVLLDKLCLDTLTLMEEEIQIKLNLEKTLTEGENNLAKCRYIMGSNAVSPLNIPLNSEVDIVPSASVTTSKSEINPDQKEYELSLEDCKDKYSDPIRWFSVLAPRNLFKSQTLYKSSLLLAVQAVNVQNQLKDMCDKIAALKYVKTSLSQTN